MSQNTQVAALSLSPMSSDVVNQWLANAARYPLLNAAQEISLGNEVRAWLDADDPDQRVIKRGRRAKEKMIKCNLRLCMAVAKKYMRRIQNSANIHIEDLLQEGAVGLNRAVEKFDPAAGYKFSTYSYWWIRQAMTRCVETQSNTIRVATHASQMAMNWRYRSHGQTVEEFAEAKNCSVDRVKEMLRLFERAQVSSLDKRISEDGADMGELLADDAIPADHCMAFADALDDLRAIPEIQDALATLELSAHASNKEMTDLLGCRANEVQKRLRDMRALIREHAPVHVREQVCGIESKQPARMLQTLPAVKPAPVRELVAVGCQSSTRSPMPEAITQPTQNGHHASLEQEAMAVIEQVQSEPVAEASKPKQRAKRTRSEVQPETVTLTIDGIEYSGSAASIAAVVKHLAVA